MIADRTKAGEAMMPTAKADKVNIPADLGKDHQAKLNAPKAAGKSALTDCTWPMN